MLLMWNLPGAKMSPSVLTSSSSADQQEIFSQFPHFYRSGTPLGQLAACFVLPISDDMGRDQAGIFQTLRDAALIQQTGGGNGFSFSQLAPKRRPGEIICGSSHRPGGIFTGL